MLATRQYPATPASPPAGIGVGGLLGIALLSAALTGLLVMAASRYVARLRMGEEIRDIMAQYMPLQASTTSAALVYRVVQL